MPTYRLQDPNYTYEDDWDAFLAKLATYDDDKVDSLVNEAKVDQKLAMIVGLSAAWRADYSRANYLERVRQEQARIIEERRMTPNPAALRPYLDADTRALLPPIKVRRRGPRQRRQHYVLATGFWRGMERGSWRGRTVSQIVERERALILDRTRESYPIWALRHPDRTPTPQADIDALHATLWAMNPKPAPKRPAIDPAGMTPERALAIAMRTVEDHDR